MAIASAGKVPGLAARVRGIDPRLPQILTLFCLLLVLWQRHDPGIVLAQAPVCLAACLAVQYGCARIFGRTPDWRALDWRSPLITGLSLSLLFRAQMPLLWVAAAGLAIGGKFLLRINGKHVFNPANFAIACLLLLLPDRVWVSPGQWGTALWLGTLFVCLGVAVLSSARRLDIALGFLLAYAALLGWRCWLLEDPIAIPIHQLQSGALLLFAFFMITDPRATPDHRLGRLLFAALVAALAYYLQFAWQWRPGLFLALFFLSPLVPLIDRLLPAPRFAWIPAH